MDYLILYAEVFFIIICFIFIFLHSHLESRKKTPSYTVLIVKNDENSIEGIVRSVIKSLKCSPRLHQPHEIIIIDTGSSDNTQQILEKLSVQYEFITVVNINTVNNN